MATTKKKITVITKPRWRMWLGTLPNGALIEFSDPENCAVARFLKAATGRKVLVGPHDFSYKSTPGKNHELPDWLTSILSSVRMPRKDTYQSVFSGENLKDTTRESIGF